MLKQIRPAIVMIVVMTVITGLAYPLAMTGIAQVVFPASGQWQPDRAGRQGDRLGADRPELHRRDKYFHGRPSATTEPDPKDPTKTDPGALCRRQFRRLESRADREGADRPGEGRCGQAAGRESRRAGAGRSGDHLGQRARPRHHAGGGAVPGAARRQGARPARGPGAPAGRRHTSRAASSASSASRMSTC